MSLADGIWRIGEWLLAPLPGELYDREPKEPIMLDETTEIHTIPGLTGRALFELSEAKDARREKDQDLYDTLRQEMYNFLVDTLGVDQGTACVACESATEGTKTVTKAGNHPSSGSRNLALLVTVDGQRIRAHYVSANADDYPGDLRFERRSPSGNYHPFTDLATLGALIEEHVR